MKKIWIVISVGILAALALILLFPTLRGLIPVAGRGVVEVVSLPRVREIPLDGLAPARAGLLIRIRSAEEIWEKLTASETFRTLRDSTLWREEEIEEKLSAAGDDFRFRTGFRLDRKRIMAVAGKDIALAVIPAEAGTPESVMVFARLTSRARLAEIVFRLGDSLKDESDRLLREEQYRGRRVVTVRAGEDFPFAAAYTVIDGNLVAAVHGSPGSLVRETIDLARGEGESLAGSPEFSSVLDETGSPPESFLELFLGPARFPEGLGRDLPPGPAAETAAWLETAFDTLRPAAAVGCRAGYREGLHARLRVVLEEEASSHPRPASPVSLPAGEMLYGLFTADPGLAGDNLAGFLGNLGVGAEGEHFPGLAGWEKTSGLSLRRDILPVFAGEWGLVFGRLTGEEFLPLPPFALISRLADREAAAGVMDRITAWAVLEQDLRPVREDYRGVEITSFPGVFFSNPAYALPGEELVVAGSGEMLRRVIDLQAGERTSLESDPDFRRVRSELDPGGRALIYLEGEGFLGSLRAAADWYFAYQRLVPEDPVIPENCYRDKVVPLLVPLENIRCAGAVFGGEKNVVNIDGFLYIPESD